MPATSEPQDSGLALKSSRQADDARRLEWVVGLILDPKHHYQLGPAWQYYGRLHLHCPFRSGWVGGVTPGRPLRRLADLPQLHTFAFLHQVSTRTIGDWTARLEHFGYIWTKRHQRGLYIAVLKMKQFQGGKPFRIPDPAESRSAVHCLSRSAVECVSGERRFHNDYTLRRRPQDSILSPVRKKTL